MISTLSHNLFFRFCRQSVFEPAFCKACMLTVRRYRVGWPLVTAPFTKPCSGHVKAFNIHVFRLTSAQCPVRQGTEPLLLVRFVVCATLQVRCNCFCYIQS